MYVITAEVALAYLYTQTTPPPAGVPVQWGGTGVGAVTGGGAEPGGSPVEPQPAPTPPVAGQAKIAGIQWSGEVPPQKWMNFYTKVLSRFAATPGLKLTIEVEVNPSDGLSKQSLEETQNVLRELGLNDRVTKK
jgi:hypothetical protein